MPVTPVKHYNIEMCSQTKLSTHVVLDIFVLMNDNSFYRFHSSKSHGSIDVLDFHFCHRQLLSSGHFHVVT